MGQASGTPANLQKQFRVSMHDLPTLDKIPIVHALLGKEGNGLALDIGIGTGYTTYSVFGERQTVCVDIHAPTLIAYQQRITAVTQSYRPLCVVARATALPFKPGIFHSVLCCDVLEHLEEDSGAVAEMARVLSDNGRAVVTVPYTGMGFTNFLELCHIKTVHDVPGPERHIRPGYDETSLKRLLQRHGLRVECQAYYLRFFTRLAVDCVSLLHLIYERAVFRRRAWTWSDVMGAERTVGFKVYARVFPLLLAFAKLDRFLHGRRGFELAVAIRKIVAS